MLNRRALFTRLSAVALAPLAKLLPVEQLPAPVAMEPLTVVTSWSKINSGFYCIDWFPGPSEICINGPVTFSGQPAPQEEA